MRFSLSWIPVIVRAVLHKEFVGPKPDKLLVAVSVPAAAAGGASAYDQNAGL